jgi:hypothetical protein
MKTLNRSRYFITYTYYDEEERNQVNGSFFTALNKLKINSSDIRQLEKDMAEEYGYQALITSYQKMF